MAVDRDQACDVPPDALVIRFRPTAPEAVLSSALKEYRRTERYRVSVFADQARPSEARAQVVGRLLGAANLSNVQRSNNRDFWICSAAIDLYDASFQFFKDGDDDEVAEHYSVELGRPPTLDDVIRFLLPFGTKEPWP